ncbi:MAG: flagellar hook-associated protein FlgK, partial [Arcobacter sp.]|nr:flagellar hook-associated protein FlgK [Arcobacter sp.]
MLSTLNVSYTGLSAAKTAVENVSNNIANENTPGYKKRVVGLSELGQMDSLFAGRGVSVDGIYRVTSQYMYDKVISENSKSNYYDKLSGMLGNVESVFKETEESGFSVDLNRYFQSIENLRTNPNSEIYKSALKNEGGILVETLQNIYSTIQKQQDAEKTELNANVEKINSLLKEIGDVNDKIVKYATATNDLYDKRDQLELELSNYVDIEINRDS